MATATNPSPPTRSEGRRQLPGGRGRTTRLAALYAGAALFLLLLVGLAAGSVGFGLPLVIALFVTLLICLGPERLGLLLLGLAFFTGPFYKAYPVLGPAVTVTDVALVAGFVLLLPRLVRGRLHLAPLYTSSAAAVLAIGAVASLMSAAPRPSFITLGQWGFCIVLLPIALMALRLRHQVLDRLAWTYVAGHVFDTVYAVATNASADGRYLGLTPHPNFFAEAGMMSVALLLHLYHRTSLKVVWWAAMGASMASVYLSGGRAATLVVIGLILLVPLVDRSALAGYFIAFAGACAAILVEVLLRVSSDSSSLGRLAGGGGADGATEARERGLQEGWDRFWSSPLSGSGLINLAEVHNNFLEIAIATGILGLFAYVLMLFTLARSLTGSSPMRRLSYTVLAYVAFGLTTPSFTDRTIWLAVALSFAVFRGYREELPLDPEERPAVTGTDRTPRTATTGGHA